MKALTMAGRIHRACTISVTGTSLVLSVCCTRYASSTRA